MTGAAAAVFVNDPTHASGTCRHKLTAWNAPDGLLGKLSVKPPPSKLLNVPRSVSAPMPDNPRTQPFEALAPDGLENFENAAAVPTLSELNRA